jgi:hypothetical protein
MEQTIKVVHVLRYGHPVCPQCKQGLETEGGSVVPRGSWDEGPLWWECEDCQIEWGHA